MSRPQCLGCGNGNHHDGRIELVYRRRILVERGLWSLWSGEFGHFHDGQHQFIYFDRSDPWDDL